MRKLSIFLIVLLGFVWWMRSRDEPEVVVTSSESEVIDEKETEGMSEASLSAITDERDLDVGAAPAAVAPVKDVAVETGAKKEDGEISALFMDLAEVLQPNNVFRDDVYGVSVEYPEGWSVKRAMRWGEDFEKSTVFFEPPEGSEAVPSMYYQEFVDTPPDPAYAEAVMREQARQKEISRLESGMVDYKNDVGSFEYKEVDGNPSLSYFATYSIGDDVHAEYFMRVIGEKGYVMFFVRGPVDDVSEVIPPVNEMGGTVSPP